MDAYVLIQTDGNIDSMVDALRAIPGVDHAEDLTGPYDAIAFARSETMVDLNDGVLRTIRELPGVTRALPAPLADHSSPDVRLLEADSVFAA
jgi:DNA-binding Lrp family transcriptional regulator